MGSDPYNKRNGYSSSNNGLSHGVSSYSTPAQDALIDQMKAEGLLSEFEKGLLISNRSFRFASSIIDEHMEEHKQIVAARKREEEEKAKNKKTWLDLDELEGNAFWYPVEQKKYLFTRREVEFYRLLKKSCSKKGFSVCPKVRIADIFNVTSDDKEEKALWFRTIAQLHVDFLVLDKYDKSQTSTAGRMSTRRCCTGWRQNLRRRCCCSAPNDFHGDKEVMTDGVEK